LLLHFEVSLGFTKRSYYSRKLVLANARSEKTVPTRGSRAGPTTHPHSRIKHKCHLPMPDPHEPRASPLLLRLHILFRPRLSYLLAFSRLLLLPISDCPCPWLCCQRDLLLFLSALFFLKYNINTILFSGRKYWEKCPSNGWGLVVYGLCPSIR